MPDATKIIAFKRPAKSGTDLTNWPGLAGFPRFERASAPVAPVPSVHDVQSVPANDIGSN